MDALEFLKIVLYLLSATLLVVLIILSIKLIGTLNKVDNTVDDLDKKIKSVDSLFNLIDGCTDKLSLLSDNVVNVITALITKIFKKRKENEKKDE